MNGVILIFIVVFVLVLAAGCALLVLRMVGNLELPESPPFPRRKIRAHRQHPHSALPDGTPRQLAGEEVAGKR